MPALYAFPFVPAYLTLLPGELARRTLLAHERLESCDLCPRECRVNRAGGNLGVCRTGVRARVSSYGPHYGEETVLSGWRGSGTIFFAGCNLRCQFCQNYEISQGNLGREVSVEEIASMMLDLQARGCHNINLVSPSHVVPQILAAISLAAAVGLRLPLVYNSGGYDSLSSLALLDGVIDIYMPDFKYGSKTAAHKYSRARNYPQIAQEAIREMHRQVGDLVVDTDGLARRGLLVRHLVLPQGLAGTKKVVEFLSKEISQNTYVNVMAQYYPAYNASRYPELNRKITIEEYKSALRLAREAGLHRLDRPFPDHGNL